MSALVLYESMYHHTHDIAAAIAEGVRAGGFPDEDVALVAVADNDPAMFAPVDLLVVGGPTHVHGMSTATTRSIARHGADHPEDLDEHDHAMAPGLRDWFQRLGHVDTTAAAAFDTRFPGPALLTGSAAQGIARRLHHHGYRLLVEPESFLVTGNEGPLEPGERHRARAGGEALAARVLGTIESS
jgi:hypothetical protein